MHLLRNAFDRGIEDSTTRITAGKSPQGTITLQAINTSDRTVITIGDDGGGGIPLAKIRDRAEFQYLPIVMLTSRSNDKHRKLAMNLGASAYFSKPYNEQELLEKLVELLPQN